MNKMNRYQQIIEKIFEARYQEGDHKVLFERADIEQAAEELQVRLPKNLGDVVYSATEPHFPKVSELKHRQVWNGSSALPVVLVMRLSLLKASLLNLTGL